MMANKFLDDNTYTNATWASISLIPLPEINRIEREFLTGIGYALFVSERVYDDWLRLLKGLVSTRYASSFSSSALRHRRHNHNHNQAGCPGDAQRRTPVRTARMLECVVAERSAEQRTEQRERIEQREQQQRRRRVSPRAQRRRWSPVRGSLPHAFEHLAAPCNVKQEPAPDAMMGMAMAGIEAPSTGAGGRRSAAAAFSPP
ncbi:hypothetical protein C8J57DRAFT_554432 [Mycena rebaudengoi]|nr:hypothetical protein C8J57DRAFT_554432 [Mycena rebaudengoi]